MRRLIINADDFGLTSGVNRAIVEAVERGLVTSATLMAQGRRFDEAVRLAKATPRLAVGCHIVLVDGFPVLSPPEIPSLLKGDNEPTFCDTASSFALRTLYRSLDPRHIEAEAAAQIRKLQDVGIAVTHVDTHKHTHIHPQVLGPLLRAASSCGVKAIRNPDEPIAMAQVVQRPRLWKRFVEVKIMHMVARRFRQSVSEAGMLTPDGSIGIVATGALDDRLLRSLLEDLPEGTWELVCHPGYDDAELQSVRTRLRESRTNELRLLTSASIRDLLRDRQIELISYRDFVRSGQLS